MIEIKSLWATPIWTSRIKTVNNEDLIRFILDEQARAPEIVVKSNRGGWQSRKNLFEDIELSGLYEEIWNVCNELCHILFPAFNVFWNRFEGYNSFKILC